MLAIIIIIVGNAATAIVVVVIYPRGPPREEADWSRPESPVWGYRWKQGRGEESRVS